MAKTLHDVAAVAGVSVSTASRVLNGKAERYRISSATAALVVQVAERLGYRANHVARGLRLQRTNTIGVVAPDIANPFFAGIIKRLQNLAHADGYSVIVCDSDETLQQEAEHLGLLFRNRVDGLIAMPVGSGRGPYDDWLARGRKLVLLDRGFEGIRTDCITVDNYEGSRTAVDLLLKHGHRKIAFLQGLPNTLTNMARLAGYRDALESAGIEVRDDLIVGGDFREESGYLETKLLLNRADPPTALFAISDLITLGAFKAIYEEGLEVPRDMSLVMFDDFEFAPYLRCPPTAIQQPRDLMAELAFKMLKETLSGARDSGEEPKHIRLRPALVERSSVSAPRRS